MENTKRILEEHVSNILKYAAKHIPVKGSARRLANREFLVNITNGISDNKIIAKDASRSLANMTARARESAARLILGIDETASNRFRFSFRLPFSE